MNIDKRFIINRQGREPDGALCACGCGQPAPVATQTDRRVGHVKGQPVRFIRGHANRRDIPDYAEQDCGYLTPCWIWNRGIDRRTGYGSTGSGADAHRRMYERAVGPVPDGLDLDHLCRVRACVNPAHLEPVTRRENNLRGMAGHRPAITLRRLSPDAVAEIRRSPKSLRDLAVAFGVSRETIRGVRIGRYYAEATT